MISHDQLAVKIALLSLVNDLPEQPSIAEVSTSEDVDDTGTSQSQDLSCDPSGTIFQRMPFKYELLAVQNLAFISAYSNDPLHVLALACHEIHDQTSGSHINSNAFGNRIMIRLAANSGTHDELLKQMRVIAKILQDEANGIERDSNCESLLLEVIRLNHGRILSRLRSRHARYYGPGSRIPLHKRLENAKAILYRAVKMPNTSMKDLVQKIDNLTSQMIGIENFETAKAQSSACGSYLLRLVKDMYEFMQYHEQEISRIPLDPGNWNKEATDSLRDRLRKLAIYVKSCELLLRIARRCKAFTKINVEFINLQEQKSPVLEINKAGTVEKVINESCSRNTLAEAATHRGITEGVLRTHIQILLRERHKLHAEMQLVKFYEQSLLDLSPRVIWSTKSACYLCHTFLKVHGRYYVPSTHGKLYQAWRYPLQTTSLKGNDHADCQNDNLKALSLKFIRVIDRKLQDCLRNCIIRRRTGCVESRVDLLAVLTPSILSVQSQRVNDNADIATTVSEAKLLERPASASIEEVCHADDDDLISSSNATDEVMVGGKPANATDISVANTARGTVVTPFSKKVFSVTHQCSTLENNKAQLLASNAKDSSLRLKSCDSETPIKAKGKTYRLLKMKHGDIASHVFPVYRNNGDDDDDDDDDDNEEIESEILRIHAPDIHVNLQHFGSMPAPARRRDSCIDGALQQENQTRLLLLNIEISCLCLFNEETSDDSTTTVFDLGNYDDDDDYCVDSPILKEKVKGKESHLPKDILFSVSGLLLKRKSTVLCLRANKNINSGKDE